MPQEPTPEESYPGYKSPEAKRTFAMMAGAVGALCAVLQFLLPIYVTRRLPPPPEVRGAMQFQAPQGETAVRWQGDLWYVATESRGSMEGCDNQPRTLLVRLNAQGPTAVFSLATGTNWLIPEEKALWILSSDGLSRYDGQKTTPAPARKLTGPTSKPFFFREALTVLQQQDQAVAVLSLEKGEWKEIARFPLTDAGKAALLPDRLKAVVAGGKPVLFYQKDSSAYSHDGFPDEKAAFPSGWQIVGPVEKGWTAGVVGDRPALLATRADSTRSGTEIDLYTLGAEGWTRSFTRTLSYPPLTLGLASPADQATILYQALPWSVTVLEVSGATAVSSRRFGELLPAKPRQLLRLLAPDLLALGVVLLGGLVLGRLMTAFRDDIYIADGVPAPLASLEQRMAAFVLDGLVIAGPFLGLLGWAYVEDQSASGNASVVQVAGLAAFLWLMVSLFLYCFCQGRWGRSIGKWAFGIRLLGMDLQPCGLGRVSLRTLVFLADSLLAFLFGVMFIAFSRHRQRLGDFVARTVVVKDTGLGVSGPK